MHDISSLLSKFPTKNHENLKLSEYIFLALRPNDSKFISADEILKKEVDLYFSCISKYSHKKLKEVFKTTFARSIFELIMSSEGLFENLIDENQISKNNKRAYKEGLARFKKGLDLA